MTTDFNSSPDQEQDGKRTFVPRKRKVALIAGIAVLAVTGIGVGLAAASGSGSGSGSAGGTSAASSGTTGSSAPQAGAGGAGQGSNARSTNEPGGTSGTISSVTGTGFSVKTTVGETITIDENSSTTYANATGALTPGEAVLVLGTVNGTTITATQVTVEPANSPYTTASADVTAVHQGQQNTSQSYGTIPTDYTEGQGTIVGSDTANQAVQTALQKYPGGIVDRVVQLPDGDYEVHDIGTNIHHIFENSSFQVIGAN
ncbi:hypothetical protein [Catenulispora rubra]|uniref:hypothetical protein n=1 Tax=Catenulispora rubra TaxID=280293 RepID=UPI0018925A51|nr:hypothetical protein [Catenulispora rubra]